MASRLLNVRLDPEDANIARQLRARGVSISDVVRRVLRDEAKKLATAPR
jgi:post-segregation antitoxin (ccd killing protein)